MAVRKNKNLLSIAQWTKFLVLSFPYLIILVVLVPEKAQTSSLISKNLVKLVSCTGTFCIYVAETAEVNIQLDSHVGGDIYRPLHPLRSFVAFH